MKTTLLTDLTVADICEGFVYNELEGKGLFGWGGRLVIQPEYQRNYIYADGKKDVVNIAGVPLNEQELLNAIYSGPFVTAAKEEFSNSNNSNLQKWKSYVKGNEKRQEILSEALDWVSKGDIDGYMGKHRRETDIGELKTYFKTVIDWIDGVFERTEDEMCGLDWGRLYETYHKRAHNPKKVWERVRALYADHVTAWTNGGATDVRNGFRPERKVRVGKQNWGIYDTVWFKGCDSMGFAEGRYGICKLALR